MKYFDKNGKLKFRKGKKFNDLFDEGYCIDEFDDEITENYTKFPPDSEIVGIYYATILHDGEFSCPESLIRGLVR